MGERGRRRGVGWKKEKSHTPPENVLCVVESQFGSTGRSRDSGSRRGRFMDPLRPSLQSSSGS